ncbi:MAG: NADH-quinone oxidoreductase subunit C [Candidatus Thorarchaeota archaeon]|nr:NADH-quinone oxidoreductase subunit C [Candidatus Thorarchaeota archaeon]
MADTSTMKASTFGRSVINKLPEVTSNLLSDSRIELVVPASKIRDVVQLVDEELSDALPESVFGVDLQNDQYNLIYIFWSWSNRLLVQLRVSLEGENPEIDSTCDIFPGLEWHERETREMFGIEFRNHPDPRLLLLPDELEGAYPLRKRFQSDLSRLDETGINPPKPRPKEGGEQK